MIDEPTQYTEELQEFKSDFDPAIEEELLKVVIAEATKDLVAKAKNLVTLIDDAEVNHGSLIGPKTLRAVGELRLEISKWVK